MNNSALLNETLKYCTLLNETKEGFTFSCVEYNPVFTSILLMIKFYEGSLANCLGRSL